MSSAIGQEVLALIIMICSCVSGSRAYSCMFYKLKANSTLKQQYCRDAIL